MKEKRKTHNTRDIYNAYLEEQLRLHPDWYTLYSRRDRSRVLYRRTEGIGKPVEMISYPRFKTIMQTYLDEAQHRIVGTDISQPEKLRMEGLGAIIVERVEQDFSKKRVNFAATMKRNEPDPATGRLKPIYWEDDYWCTIAWDKPNRTPLMIAYEFKPVDSERPEKPSFGSLLQKVIKDRPEIKFRYRFKPILRNRQPDRPRHQWEQELDEARQRRIEEEARAELQAKQAPDQTRQAGRPEQLQGGDL